MLKKAAALLFVCASTLGWIGCGSTVSHYVYAAIPSSNQVAAYREDPNSGVLTAVAGSPFAAGLGAHSVALHPSKKYLYVANSGESDISLFTIGSKGELTEVTPRPAAGTVPMLLTMDSAGTHLYVANSISNDISVFSISSSDGALTVVPGSPFPIGIAPISMKLSPSGNFLYVGGAGSPGLVEAFSLSAGTLTPIGSYQTGTNPYGLAIDSTGTYLYTANAGGNSISEFTIDSTGALSEISGSPIGESYSTPAALLVDPSGKYLYVANQGSNNVAAYTIASDGSLTILSNSPFSAGSGPNSLAADPSGKYLLVGEQSGNSIQVFGLTSSNGTLSSVGSYSTGSAPTSIVVTP